MAANQVVSIHGNGARINPSADITIEHLVSSAQIRSRANTSSNPRVFFSLPSPAPSTTRLSTLTVTFSTTTGVYAVSVTNVQVHLGDSLKLNTDVQHQSTFSVNIPQDPVPLYTDVGICVALTLNMPGNSQANFVSVAIRCIA